MIQSTDTNPLSSGSPDSLFPQPCTLVIFGGAGDLSRRKLLPAIYNLGIDGVLPTNFAVLGFSLDDLDDRSYRDFARSGVEEFSRQSMTEQQWSDYERTIFYQRGTFDDPECYEALKRRLEAVEPLRGIPGNRVFYLAVPPGSSSPAPET